MAVNLFGFSYVLKHKQTHAHIDIHIHTYTMRRRKKTETLRITEWHTGGVHYT